MNQGLKVSGSYVRFHEDEVERNKFLALTKNAMEVTFTGNANEQVQIRLASIRLDDSPVEAGLDDLLVSTGTFTAELDTAQVPNQIDVRVDNDKSEVY